MSLLEDEKKTADREKSIVNEKAKLQAAYANGLAIALPVVGAISPAISTHPDTARAAIVQGLVGLVCLIGSAVLHTRGQRALESIQ